MQQLNITLLEILATSYQESLKVDIIFLLKLNN